MLTETTSLFQAELPEMNTIANAKRCFALKCLEDVRLFHFAEEGLQGTPPENKLIGKLLLKIEWPFLHQIVPCTGRTQYVVLRLLASRLQHASLHFLHLLSVLPWEKNNFTSSSMPEAWVSSSTIFHRPKCHADQCRFENRMSLQGAACRPARS